MRACVWFSFSNERVCFFSPESSHRDPAQSCSSPLPARRYHSLNHPLPLHFSRSLSLTLLRSLDLSFSHALPLARSHSFTRTLFLSLAFDLSCSFALVLALSLSLTLPLYYFSTLSLSVILSLSHFLLHPLSSLSHALPLHSFFLFLFCSFFIPYSLTLFPLSPHLSHTHFLIFTPLPFSLSLSHIFPFPSLSMHLSSRTHRFILSLTCHFPLSLCFSLSRLSFQSYSSFSPCFPHHFFHSPVLTPSPNSFNSNRSQALAFFIHDISSLTDAVHLGK